MAELTFTSQQSDILIDVSENLSSAKSSPQAESHAQTHVQKSPSIQAISSSEACIPESAERVEHSYQESYRTTVPVTLAGDDDDDDDDEEDLYTVSPSGKAKLETAIAASKRTQDEQVWQP